MSGYADMFAAYSKLMASYFDTMRGAPDTLSQSILPDWSLIRIDETNSSAPDTEKAIVAEASYGKQLGRIMDALDVLIKASGKSDPAFVAFDSLKKEIDAIKNKNVLDRIDALREDIDGLKEHHPKAYREAAEKFRAAAKETPAS